jgi:hypothetical protein
LPRPVVTAPVWGKGINNPGRVLLLANGEVGGKLEAFAAFRFFALVGFWTIFPPPPRHFFLRRYALLSWRSLVGNAASPR